eukprot:jgi/Undpi1/13566/HiC_scaffold_8.g03225.m1
MSLESAHTHPGAPSSVCTGTGCPGYSSDGSTEALLRRKEDLAKRIIGQQFPWMGDCAPTWDNAVGTVMRDLGEGFELRRHNKENLFTKAQESTRCPENRPRRVVMSCLQAGKPSNNLLIGCQWGVTMQWPQKLNGPKISQHPCPRTFDNEVTMAEIDNHEEMIRDLHEARVGTKEIYKVLEKEGKVLEEERKSKTSSNVAVVRTVHQSVTSTYIIRRDHQSPSRFPSFDCRSNTKMTLLRDFRVY